VDLNGDSRKFFEPHLGQYLSLTKLSFGSNFIVQMPKDLQGKWEAQEFILLFFL